MNKKVFTFMIAILLATCTGATGFYAGKAAGQGEPQKALERLQQLNRAGI